MTIKGLEAKILAKKGKIVEIEFEGQKISVPREYLPAESEEGDFVSFHFLSSSKASMQEKQLAKSILEEILNGK